MSFIDEVRADRQPLADVLKKHRGIRKVVEDLYPDRAHFIYELLQNAEDAGATEALFDLTEPSVSFEHNGRSFTEKDIWAITDIGEGTKLGDDDKIGRFGVGFKAVFLYTETPHVWSPSFSFRISDLVLPTEIPSRSDIGRRTRFEFPFNNPKKSRTDAYAEIGAGLEELAETTLLFLSNLKAVSWRLGDKTSDQIVRIQHAKNHIEIQRRTNGEASPGAHFLRFSKPAEGLEKQTVSVAFVLQLLPQIKAFDPEKPTAQFKIVPATPGRVAVFFPAEKESSGLRFHVHAPFVPELSRASIKDTPANEPLFTQLAKLLAESLRDVCGQRLLTGDFLGVLPNPQDNLPKRYEPIRLAIVHAMNEEALTPTFSGSHAPARLLLQASASLKELLSLKDLDYLVGHNGGAPQWAIGATQKNSTVDRFLASLAIRTWDIDRFVEHLEMKSSEGQRFVQSTKKMVVEPDPHFMRWFAAKPLAWHKQIYSLLYSELGSDGARKRLNGLKVVRLSGGTYSVGGKCYFAGNDAEKDNLFPFVEREVYRPAKNETDRNDARLLLEAIGVKEVGEAERVEAILKQRYSWVAGQTAASQRAFRPEINDTRRFADFVLAGENKDNAKLFRDYHVVKGLSGKWLKPAEAYVDSPVFETGLASFYELSGTQEKRSAVSPDYANLAGINRAALQSFFDVIGVRVRLECVETRCAGNPDSRYLYDAPGYRSAAPIDRDYVILGLDKALDKPTIELSKLVWQTMREQPRQKLEAKYQKNSTGGPHTAPSQLVHVLRKYAWVPQGNGRFVRPAEADRNVLPDEGFPFAAGDFWIKQIQFAEESQQRAEQNKKKEADAKEMGFPDAATLERAQKFAALPYSEQERILAEYDRPTELPRNESSNPERRAEKVGAMAAVAPERLSEQRMRAVSVGTDELKQKAQQYLRQYYTNANGEMICQICKAPLPFKLADGSYYCEKVEFLTELEKRHYQNYLSLCPNHGAMFQHVNGSREQLKDLFVGMIGEELGVVLAQEPRTIHFTKTHIVDLRTIIDIDTRSE
jgi:hypothetical protein